MFLLNLLKRIDPKRTEHLKVTDEVAAARKMILKFISVFHPDK